MRVGFSAEFIATRPCGVATATQNLLWGMARLGPQLDHSVYAYVATAAAVPLVPRTARVRPRLVRPYNALLRVPFTLPLELMRHPVDVLHAHNWAPRWVPCPMVTTVYDLSWEVEPRLYPRALRWRLHYLVRSTAQRSLRVITPSLHSARDIERLYGIAPERIRVIPCPRDPSMTRVTDSQRVTAVLDRHGIRQPYVLYVGSLEPRKNVDQLIRAYAALHHQQAVSHQLVLAGIPLRLYDHILQLPRELGIEHEVLFTGRLPADDLAPLYSGADVFAYLATHEGFGYPPLEAMACGAPVLAARRASLPEVLGEAALLVDPDDQADIVRGLKRLLDEPRLREHYTARGREHVQRFNPERIAARVVDVYEECLAEGRRTAWRGRQVDARQSLLDREPA